MASFTADDRHMRAMFAAADNRDMDKFRECFVPDAKIWHSFDGAFMSVEETILLLQGFHKLAEQIGYKDQKIFKTDRSTYFVQHSLTAKLHSGACMELPVVMRIDLGDDGRVVALYEYYDSRGTDCLKVEGQQTSTHH